MSVAWKNEPYRQGDPGRIVCAIATPDSASATCCASPPATLTAAVAPPNRNGVTTVAWFDSAHAIIASTIRKSQISGLTEFTTPIKAVRSPRSPPCTIRAISMPSRAFGPLVPYVVYGRSDQRSVEYSMSRWRVLTSIFVGSHAPVCAQLSGDAACVSLMMVSWPSSVPARRPSSRSLRNGGPPTPIHNVVPSPTSTVFAGLRACNVKVCGALASCSMTNPRSKYTRSPSTFCPAFSSSRRASSCKTSRPISSQIRIAYSWTCSSCSAVIGRGACSGVYSIGVLPICVFDQGREQLIERLDPEVVDLERLLHVVGDLASLRLAGRIGVLAHEQHTREVVEVRLFQPREPVEAEPLDHRTVPVRHEPVGQEVDPVVLVEPLEEIARVPLEAVHAGRTDRGVALEHLVEAAAGAAVAVHDDHPLVVGQELLDLLLDGRADLDRRHVEVARDPVDVGVPAVRVDERRRVPGDGAACDQGDARAGAGHPAASCTLGLTGSSASRSGSVSRGGSPRLPMNRSLKSSTPDSSMYSTKLGISQATSRSRNDISAIFAPSLAVLPTALILSTVTAGTRPITCALRGLMYEPNDPASITSSRSSAPSSRARIAVSIPVEMAPFANCSARTSDCVSTISPASWNARTSSRITMWPASGWAPASASSRVIIFAPSSSSPASLSCATMSISPEPQMPLGSTSPPITCSSTPPLVRTTPSIAPSVARIPYKISPPSKAGPAGAAVATERSALPHAISPLVPTSTSSRVCGPRTKPVATMSATMSAPT